jgi:formylglycine-generating enzyme required for sulfatase activity
MNEIRIRLGNRVASAAVGLLLLGACTTNASGDTATSEPQFFQDCDTCPELVRVEPGEFQMGLAEGEAVAPGYRKDQILEEHPAHRVQIDYPFAIGRYEVTISEFAEFAAATDFVGNGCFVLVGDAWQFNLDANFRAPGFDVTEKDPAACLSYDDSVAYLQWLSDRIGQTYRLPTEAEWEYTVRSGQGDEPAPTYLGAQACEYLNGSDVSFSHEFAVDWRAGLFECDDGYAATSPVGSYKPNKLGMYDVFGNVAEWTEDCSGTNYDGAPADGSAIHRVPCTARTLRGGTFSGGPGYQRPSRRGGSPLQLRGDGHGLRVVRELVPGRGQMALISTVMVGDVAAGKTKSLSCAACHGPDGVSPSPMWPNLAKQNADYTIKQLKDFRSGTRADGLMSMVATGLTDADIADLAAYYAGL